MMNRAPAEVDRFVPRLRDIEQILYAVAEVYGCLPEAVLGRTKPKTVAEARLCAYLVARRCTRMSLSEIGGALGRDHTTVLSGIASAKRKAERDPYFAGVLAELCERFGESVEPVKQ